VLPGRYRRRRTLNEQLIAEELNSIYPELRLHDVRARTVMCAAEHLPALT
jgi:hypothetical protein